MKTFFWGVWRYGRWVLLTILVLYIALVIYRIPAMGEKERSDNAVTFIHAQTITMEDVTGENLPPVPNKEINDSTIEGIDANSNGIRDDVELAIFEEYPNDIKIRAAMLQYAMAVQMYLVEVFDFETWKAVEIQQSRGSLCLIDSLPKLNKETATDEEWNRYFARHDLFIEEVENLVLNTSSRDGKYNEVFSKFITSTSGNDKDNCDLNPEELSN